MRNFINLLAISLTAGLSGCSTNGNAPNNSEIKPDFVAGYSGEDRVIVTDDNASIHSDRDAVREYTSTVNTINGSRQAVDSDLVGLVLCRKFKAEGQNMLIKEGPMTVPCMQKVVLARDRAGTDLIQVNGKLVLRKKDDFKSRLDEAHACLDQMVEVRDKARQDYMLERCSVVIDAQAH